MPYRSAQLYRAATELFVERGYRDVDVADIAARCEVSPGTFYNYFSNKRDMLDVILGRTIDSLVQAATGKRDPTGITDRNEYFAELEGRIRALLEYIAENGELVAFAGFTAPGLDEAAYAATLHGFREISAQFTAFLSTGCRRGWIRDDVDLQIAGQLVASCTITAALPVLFGDTADEFDPVQIAADCCTYLLGGRRSLIPK